ncbi:MAG: gliding motility-associated C-terminal domain-containing protein [Flavobacteriales bacterium]|nr:gliding motility-associated C-terminal domain-containing protein [Flavobacteriales bacterium]
MFSEVRSIALVCGVLLVSCGSAQDKVFVSTDQGGLYQVDIDACYTRTVGYSPVTFLDIAFTPNGRLWGILGNALYEIDTTDASISLVGITPGFGTPGLVSFDNDVLLGERGGSLWGIRTIDGFAWPIAPIGFTVSGDLTWFEGKLYITANSPFRLVRMDVAPDLSAVTNIEVMGLLGGGFGQWYGANTTFVAPCAAEPYIMLALDGVDVYKVSPVDASVQPLCLGLFIYGTHGAASFGESRDAPVRDLRIPNVFSPNKDGSNELFGPIFENTTAQWHQRIYDRWGQLVHDSGGRPIAWNGRTKAGESCPEGVYFYSIQLTEECGGAEEYHGHVSLLR